MKIDCHKFSIIKKSVITVLIIFMIPKSFAEWTKLRYNISQKEVKEWSE